MRAATTLVIKLTLLNILFFSVQADGQDAIVRRISGETADGVLFTLWGERQTVTFGQDVIVNYQVENRSRRTIYLVQKGAPEMVSDRSVITIETPRPLPIHHGDYDYTFTEVRQGSTQRGQVTIPKEMFDVDGVWRVEVGLGYVTDITGLNRRLGATDDPAPLRSLLDSRIETVLLGRLSIEVVRAR